MWDFLSGTDATELVCEFLLQQILTLKIDDVNVGNSTDKIQNHSGDRHKTESKEEVNNNFKIDHKDDRKNHLYGRLNADAEQRTNRQSQNQRGCRGSILHHSAMHDAARLLAIEAYVRGSMDNVGVCVVDLLPFL